MPCSLSAAAAMPRRLTGHDRDTGGERSHSAGDPVRLPMGNTDFPVIDPERVGADLRHHGLHALADRSGAGDDLDRAVAVHRDAHCRTARARSSPRTCATPAPTFSPAARRGPALAHARPVDGDQAPCRAARRNRRSRRRSRCRASRAARAYGIARRRSGFAAVFRRDPDRACSAIASSKRSRTNVLSNRPGAR